MEFLAYEDGTLRDERYRTAGIVDEPIVKPRKVYHHETNVSTPGMGDIQEVTVHDGVSGFTHNPKTVCFENFTIGETYTVAVVLTNCGNRSTSFRVLPISIKYRDVLRVEYVLPPKISAGLSWKVQVIFTPEENVDLETVIGFRTEEGIFFVPVKAFRKRSLVSADPDCLDFGVVIFGEKVTKVLTLHNTGALAAKVFISGSLRKWMEVFHNDLQNGKETPVITIKPVAYQILVNPFLTSRLEVTFSPNQEVIIDDEIELRYESDGAPRTQRIPVKATGGSLPVYVSSSSVIDFKCCFYESTYCEKIVITNATNVSATVIPELPSALASSVAFSPNTTCIQGNSTFDLYILFTPRRGMELDISSVIKMAVSGQTAPISVTLKAQLTERGFSLEPNKLDYGTSGMKEEIILPLKIKNLSDLAQCIGVLKLPENVHVRPFQTVTLLPKEVFELKIGVRPPTLGQYTQVIKFTNEYGDTRSVQLAGYGYKHCMEFSKPCLNLPACPLSGETTCTTLLENRSAVAHSFCLISPNTNLKVSPSSGILDPGRNIPIVVIFRAPEPQQPVVGTLEENATLRQSGKSSFKKRKERENQNPLAGATERDAVSLDTLYKDWEANYVGGEWSRHSTFLVKCIGAFETDKFIILLQVNCTVIKPTLAARSLSRVVQKTVVLKELPRRSGKKNVPAQNITEETLSVVELSRGGTYLHIEFGEVPLRQINEKTCLLQNSGEKTINLQLRPINTLSPFQIVKLPPVKLSEKGECAVGIRFAPTEYGKFKDSIIIASSDANDVTLSLSGICRPADLLVSRESDPPTTTTPTATTGSRIQSLNEFVFDTVLVGHENRHSLYIHNLSSLPVEVSAKFLTNEGDELKWPELESFIIESDRFNIPGNSKVSTALIFCPQAIGTLFASLHFTAGAFHHTVLLKGRSSERPFFFTFGEDDTKKEDTCMVCSGLQREVFPEEGFSPVYPFQIICGVEEAKTIMIGCVKFGANFECIVNGWNESYLENGWKLEPMKATVPSGGQVAFSLTYDPKREIGDVAFCTFSFMIKYSQPPTETQCYVRCTGTIKA